MATAATNRRLRNILVSMRNETLVTNPSFQRRLVWINKHKVAFIQTVLDELPFPEVFIAAGEVDVETGLGTEVVVDGQQRLTTLYEYFTGSGEISLGNLPAYKDLSNEEKTSFLEYEVVIRDLGSITESDTRELFRRINSTSYGLNAMEVNNGRYDGELKKFCESLTESTFFENFKIFSVQDGRRMGDTKWVLTLVITLLSDYFNRDNEHQNYLDEYNEEFPHKVDILQRINDAFNKISIPLLDASNARRLQQKSDLFTLVVEIDRFRNDNLDVSAALTDLAKFYSEIDELAARSNRQFSDEVQEYFSAARSGTNDLSSRRRRGAVIEEILTRNIR